MTACSTPRTSWKTRKASVWLRSIPSAVRRVVPTGIVRAPGRVGRTYGVVEWMAYCVGVMMRPKWPCAPPPRLERTDCALA